MLCKKHSNSCIKMENSTKKKVNFHKNKVKSGKQVQTKVVQTKAQNYSS